MRRGFKSTFSENAGENGRLRKSRSAHQYFQSVIIMKKPRFDAWKKIAKERIEILSELARQQPAYAKRYKELTAKISKKYKIKVQEAR